MKLYDLKIHFLTKFYVKCPFTHVRLDISGFRAKKFDIDHIYSIPRSGRHKLIYREENIDIFESIINLRPLEHNHHIDMNCKIKYDSPLKWEKWEFEEFCRLFKESNKYDDLKMLRMIDDMEYIDDLINLFFKELDINRPDWMKRNK